MRSPGDHCTNRCLPFSAALLAALAGLGVSSGAASAQFVWQGLGNPCASEDWFSSCTLRNQCPGGGDVCDNNWNSATVCIPFGCAPFPGPGSMVTQTVNSGPLRLRGGAVNIASFQSENLFTLNSQFQVAGMVQFSGGAVFEWEGGELDGPAAGDPAPTELGGQAHFMTTGAIKGMRRRHVSNPGMMTVLGSGELRVTDGSVIDNTGTWAEAVDHQISFYGGLPCRFNNSGVFIKSGGTGQSGVTGVFFNSTGRVDVRSGTLLLGDGLGSGPFDLAAGAAAQFGNGFTGPFGLDEGARISGEGRAEVAGRLTFLADIPAENLRLTGTLDGPGDCLVTGLFTWSGSGQQRGTGRTAIFPGSQMRLEPSGDKGMESRTLQNDGLVTVAGPSPFRMFVTGGGLIDNRGMWLDQSDYPIFAGGGGGGGGGMFLNSGTYRKEGGFGQSELSLPFVSSGVVEVRTGRLLLGGGSASGAFSVSGGATLQLGNGFSPLFRLDPGAAISGPGLVLIGGVASLANGAAVPIERAELRGSIRGVGEAVITGSLLWTAGSQLDAGRTTIALGASCQLAAPGDKFLESRVLVNQGTVNVTGPAGGLQRLNLREGAVIDNRGLFVDAASYQINFNGGTPTSFINSGVFRKEGATEASSIGVPVVNSGRVEVRTGTLFVQGGDGYMQVSGVTSVASGAELRVGASPPLRLLAGRLEGVGTVRSDLEIVGAAVTPGDASITAGPATLTVTGRLTLGPAAALEVDLAQTPGESGATVADRLAVGGDAALAGTLRVRLEPGLDPEMISPGTVFDVLTARLIGGAFTNLDLPQLPGGRRLVVRTTSTAVKLLVARCAADYNGDGNVDPDDLGDYITCYFGPAPAACGADFNVDASINPDDLGDFITTYFSPGC